MRELEWTSLDSFQFECSIILHFSILPFFLTTMVPFSLTNKSVYKPQSPAAEGKGKLAVSLSPSRRIPGGSDGKEFTCNAGDPGLIPRSDPRVRKKENGYPLQFSCLENPMDRGAWWARVHGVAKSQTRLSD